MMNLRVDCPSMIHLTGSIQSNAKMDVLYVKSFLPYNYILLSLIFLKCFFSSQYRRNKVLFSISQGTTFC